MVLGFPSFQHRQCQKLRVNETTTFQTNRIAQLSNTQEKRERKEKHYEGIFFESIFEPLEIVLVKMFYKNLDLVLIAFFLQSC